MLAMTTVLRNLPDLDCGQCGLRTCAAFAAHAADHPDASLRCPHLDPDTPRPLPVRPPGSAPGRDASASGPWLDTLGREFDFFLEHFPEEPGPREQILPHNPMLTRELGVARGDTLIGRPLGLSCGCPVTHCGVATDVDPRTGLVTWCVTGPLGPRGGAFKDLGFYSAQAYEGLVREARCELRIGERHFFQPRMCMLLWRHSGLVNYLNRSADGVQVRLEGLWIG